MLQNQIVPAIRQITGNNFENIWFQQDRVPPHCGVNVRNYLDETFPDRWIDGAIEWPARSLDLTPLDYFLWGSFKK